MTTMDNKDINWEERRFLAAALILGGMAANFNNPFTPGENSIRVAIFLSEKLIQTLADPSYQSICPELYQREDAEL